MNSLTVGEIKITLEAIDAWESQPSIEGLNVTMLELLLSKRDNVEEYVKQRHEESMNKVSDRKEIAILLKAKLIQMKNAIPVEGAST